MAAISLGGPVYNRESATIIPALIGCLNDTNAQVRAWTSQRLGLYRTAARNAVPALSRLLSDNDNDVQAKAKWALQEIDPEAVPKLKPEALESQKDPK